MESGLLYLMDGENSLWNVTWIGFRPRFTNVGDGGDPQMPKEKEMHLYRVFHDLNFTH